MTRGVARDPANDRRRAPGRAGQTWTVHDERAAWRRYRRRLRHVAVRRQWWRLTRALLPCLVAGCTFREAAERVGHSYGALRVAVCNARADESHPARILALAVSKYLWAVPRIGRSQCATPIGGWRGDPRGEIPLRMSDGGRRMSADDEAVARLADRIGRLRGA